MQAPRNLDTAAGVLARRIVRALGQPVGTFDRIRLCFVTLIVLGLIFVVTDLVNQRRVDDILQRGVATEATATRTRLTGRYIGYAIDLTWRDARGAQRNVDGMSVSAAYFGEIFRVGVSPKVRIKYLADRDASQWTVTLPDDPSGNSPVLPMIRPWLLTILLGLAGVVPMTLWSSRRRRRDAQMA